MRRPHVVALMRRGAGHRLKFAERCGGGGCRRGAGEFGAGEQVSRYGWAKGQRSTPMRDFKSHRDCGIHAAAQGGESFYSIGQY